ncbi:LysR family transcriptional regulator [Variovorax sp. LARHSF232]
MGFAYTDLLCFQAVVAHGHVGRAATALQLGQPAVSKIIRRVEDAVGTPLFQRGAHGVVLTGSGQLFLESARQLVQQHEETLRVARDIQAQHAGLLRLGMTLATSESRAARAVSELIRNRPGLRVLLEIGKSDDLERALLQGRLDLAVVPSYPGQVTTCAQIVIGGDELLVAARPRHPLFAQAGRQGAGLRLQDLQPYGWALPSRDSAARKMVEQAFADRGLGAPMVVLEIEHNTDAAMDIVGGADLLCFVPSYLLQRRSEQLQALPLADLRTRRHWMLISRPDATWSPLMTALRDLVAG